MTNTARLSTAERLAPSDCTACGGSNGRAIIDTTVDRDPGRHVQTKCPKCGRDLSAIVLRDIVASKAPFDWSGYRMERSKCAAESGHPLPLPIQAARAMGWREESEDRDEQ